MSPPPVSTAYAHRLCPSEQCFANTPHAWLSILQGGAWVALCLLLRSGGRTLRRIALVEPRP